MQNVLRLKVSLWRPRRLSACWLSLVVLPGSHVQPEAMLDERAVKNRLREWVARDMPSSVLVWLGHGASDGTDAWLACFDTHGKSRVMA